MRHIRPGDRRMVKHRAAENWSLPGWRLRVRKQGVRGGRLRLLELSQLRGDLRPGGEHLEHGPAPDNRSPRLRRRCLPGSNLRRWWIHRHAQSYQH